MNTNTRNLASSPNIPSAHYRPTPIESLSVAVSIVPAEQLLNTGPSMGGSVPNKNFSFAGMPTSALTNSSITNTSFMGVGTSLVGAYSASTGGKSYADVLLLKKMNTEGNPLLSSTPDATGDTLVPSRKDAYRVHLLIDNGSSPSPLNNSSITRDEAPASRRQVAQVKTRWQQYEQLVRFALSVSHKFEPPTPPSELAIAIDRNGSFILDTTQYHTTTDDDEGGGNINHPTPHISNTSFGPQQSEATSGGGAVMSSSYNSASDGMEDTMLTPADREVRRAYMERYLNKAIKDKSVNCLKEVQMFVGYLTFIQNERHQFQLRQKSMASMGSTLGGESPKDEGPATSKKDGSADDKKHHHHHHRHHHQSHTKDSKKEAAEAQKEKSSAEKKKEAKHSDNDRKKKKEAKKVTNSSITSANTGMANTYSENNSFDDTYSFTEKIKAAMGASVETRSTSSSLVELFAKPKKKATEKQKSSKDRADKKKHGHKGDKAGVKKNRSHSSTSSRSSYSSGSSRSRTDSDSFSGSYSYSDSYSSSRSSSLGSSLSGGAAKKAKRHQKTKQSSDEATAATAAKKKEDKKEGRGSRNSSRAEDRPPSQDVPALDEESVLMVEECFRMIDRSNKGYLTTDEMRWFLLCAFGSSFGASMRALRAAVAMPRNASDPLASTDASRICNPPPVGRWDPLPSPDVTVLPLWFRTCVGLENVHSETPYNMRSFVKLVETAVQEGARWAAQQQRPLQPEETLSLVSWLDQFWMLEYSWIFIASAALVNGEEGNELRSQLHAIKEKAFGDLRERRREQRLQNQSSSSPNSYGDSTTTSPLLSHPTMDLVPWTITAAATALINGPAVVLGLDTMELLALLFVLSSSGLRLVSMEEVLQWTVSRSFLQCASFTFEELSSLLDSLSKAMPFSEVLRSLCHSSTSGTSAHTLPGGGIQSYVLRLVSRSAPTVDPVILSEVDDKIIQHDWRVRGGRCSGCERTCALLAQHEQETDRLYAECDQLQLQASASEREAAALRQEREDLQREVQSLKQQLAEAEAREEDLIHALHEPREESPLSTHHRHHSRGRKRQDTARPPVIVPETSSSKSFPTERESVDTPVAGTRPPLVLLRLEETGALSNEAVTTPGPLLYRLPRGCDTRPHGFSISFYPCAKSADGRREYIVFRDSNGRRSASFLLEGLELKVCGSQSMPRAKTDTMATNANDVSSSLSAQRRCNLLFPSPVAAARGNYGMGSSTLEYEYGQTEEMDGDTVFARASVSLTLQPRTWHRLTGQFDWEEGSFTAQLEEVPAARDGEQPRSMQQVDTLHMVEADGRAAGVCTVDIFPRTQLLFSYCNLYFSY